MTARPLYVGVGTCGCGRTDVRLYQVPSTKTTPVLHCSKCLLERGYEVPTPRTAADIETVNGVTRWRT